MMHILGRSRLDQTGHLLPHPRLQRLPRWPAEPLPRIVAMRRRPFSGAQPGSAVTGQLKGTSPPFLHTRWFYLLLRSVLVLPLRQDELHARSHRR